MEFPVVERQKSAPLDVERILEARVSEAGDGCLPRKSSTLQLRILHALAFPESQHVLQPWQHMLWGPS